MRHRSVKTTCASLGKKENKLFPAPFFCTTGLSLRPFPHSFLDLQSIASNNRSRDRSLEGAKVKEETELASIFILLYFTSARVPYE